MAHTYAGVQLQGRELNQLQHKFQDRIKVASRIGSDGALLIGFTNGSKNYTPSRAYRAQRSRYMEAKKHGFRRVELPLEIKEKGDHIEVISQIMISIKLAKRFNKLFRLLKTNMTVTDN